MRELELIFGCESAGDTPQERARTSKRRFVRSQDHLSVYDESTTAKGRIFSAWEAYCTYGIDILREAIDKSSAILVVDDSEPASTIRLRRELLGLSIEQVAKQVGIEAHLVEDAENKYSRTPIRVLEKLARSLGLDEKLISFERGAGGDNQTAVALRRTVRGNVDFSPSLLLDLGEATWVISTQTRIRNWLTLNSDFNWKNIRTPSTQVGEENYSATEHGQYLARATRQRLGLGDGDTINSLSDLCENKLGIPVIHIPLPKTLAGLTIINSSAAGIVINSQGANDNIWVKRFTIAHELAHLLFDSEEFLRQIHLDSYSQLTPLSNFKVESVEIRANAFASEFLAPMLAVEDEFKKHYAQAANSDAINDGLRAVMERFGINYTASKHQVWWALDKQVDFDSLKVTNVKPNGAWQNKEQLTKAYFKTDVMPRSRQGYFALLAIEAEEKNLISEDTSAEYLSSKSLIDYTAIKRIISYTFFKNWGDSSEMNTLLEDENEFHAFQADLKQSGTGTLVSLVLERASEGLAVKPDSDSLRRLYIELAKLEAAAELTDKAIDLIVSWLPENFAGEDMFLSILSLLTNKGASEHTELALEKAYNWLENNPLNVRAFRSYHTLVIVRGSFNHLIKAMRLAEKWLLVAPEDSQVKPLYLDLVRRFSKLVIDDTSKWVSLHEDDQDMVASYLRLVKETGNTNQTDRAFKTIYQILDRQPQNNPLASAFLSFVYQRGTAQQLAKLIQDTARWLSKYDNAVKDKLIGLVEDRGTDAQKRSFLDAVSVWLDMNPEDNFIRSKILNFVKKYGHEKQVNKILAQLIQWLSESEISITALLQILPIIVETGTTELQLALKAKIKPHIRELSDLPSDQDIVNYGRLLLQLKEYGEAYNLFEALYEENDDKSWLLLYLAQSLTGLGRYNLAELHLTEAIRIIRSNKNSEYNKQEGRYLYHLGLVYFQARKFDKAKKTFQEAINKSSETSSVNFRSKWRLAQTLIEGEGAYQEAERLLTTALERTPQDINLSILEEAVSLLDQCRGGREIR